MEVVLHQSVVQSSVLDNYLPPYRSLLTPHLKYDYRLHRNIELTVDEIHTYHNIIHPEPTKTHKIKMKYRSLLTDTKKKLFNSDLFSLNSTTATTNLLTKPRPPFIKRTFQDLPQEVLESILSHLQDDQKTLVNCLYVSKTFNAAAKRSLYYNPYLTSTYRVGQFVTTLQHNNDLGKLVKVLDLSKLVPGWDFHDNNDDIDIFRLVFNTDLENLEELLNHASYKDTPSVDTPPIASWRDWKYRDSPLYGRRPSANKAPILSRQMTNSTLVSNGSSANSSSKFKYQNKSRSNSDATLVRPTGEFYDMYRNFDTMLFDSSDLQSSSSSSNGIINNIQSRKSRHLRKMRQFFHKQRSNHRDPRSQLDTSKPAPVLDLKQTERKPYYEPFTESHPLTNKFLNKYAVTKDLPIGYIIHLLYLCPNIVELNLSNLSISSDFRIVPNDFKLTPRQFNYDESYEKSTNDYFIQSLIPSIKETDELSNLNEEDFIPHYRAKSLKHLSRMELSTNFVFLSDVGIANLDYNNKRLPYKSVKLTTMDVIESFSSLPYLSKLNLNNCIWVDKRAVLKFLDLYRRSKNNLEVDLIDSGMIRNSNWGIQGTVKDLANVFKSEKKSIKLWEEMYSLIHHIGENY